MEQDGVIKKIAEEQPTDWVNNLVYQRKSTGKIRIYLDSKDLNETIQREHHVPLTLGEIMPQDIFQQRIDQLIEGLEGVLAIADDIIVFGSTQSEHDKNLRKLKVRCRQFGLTLNPDKISMPEVKFYRRSQHSVTCQLPPTHKSLCRS